MKKSKYKIIATLIIAIILGVLFYVFSPDGDKKVGLFYEVEKGGKTTILGGTIHVGKEDINFSDSVMDSFNEADVLAVEVDPNNEEILWKSLEKMFYNNGEKLTDGFSDKGVEIVKKESDKFQLPKENMLGLKPMYFSEVIMTEYLKKYEYFTMFGIESKFLELASLNKEIESIEELEDLTKMADIGTKSDQEKYHILSLEAYETEIPKETLDFMYSTILEGDLSKLEEGIKNNQIKHQKYYEGISESFLKEYERALINDRNIKMADRIEEFINRDKKYFSLVGAAHLYGEQGVLKLLENRGYTISQIK